jgi:hypothetical protein
MYHHIEGVSERVGVSVKRSASKETAGFSLNSFGAIIVSHSGQFD